MTWVEGFPTGDEKGDFLTVDLGGTNLRVCWINLKGNKEEIGLEQEQYTLPEHIKTGKAEDLFSFIAESLQSFIKDQNLTNGHNKNDPLNLGFTFSYPAIQDSIDHAVLQTWTKGFDIKGVEGEDVASQLRDAMKKLDLPITLVAVVNDTTGAMIASAYHDPSTVIGAIFGTGCNAAYMDKISNIPKVKTKPKSIDNPGKDKINPDTPMAINCEYGAFDNSRSVLPITKYDKQIDSDSPRPGEQAFEKMSAGLYLGEIYRLIIMDLHSRSPPLFFADQDTSKLSDPYTIDTAFLADLEHDASSSLKDSAEQFKSSFSVDITAEELEFSRDLAHIITIRGARLCATGIAAICLHQGIEEGHVAADGSVANKHPTFKKRWGEALGEILGWSGKERRKKDGSGGDDEQEGPIVMTSAEDGSGVGAAVIAAMTLERRRKGENEKEKGKDR